MSRTVYGPGTGAIPSMRPDESMGSEHVRWRIFNGREYEIFSWLGMRKVIKRSMTKKRRQHDRELSRVEED